MANPKLEPGEPAPAFRGPTGGGGEVGLEDMAGQRFVLYFYPRDSTPGCTTEACDFRDNLARLQAAGVGVIGVSPDSVASHERFMEKQGLAFPLLSDPDHAIAEAYGVWREKKSAGKVRMGIVRSTFVIGPGGEIERIYDNVKAKGHVERVLTDIL